MRLGVRGNWRLRHLQIVPCYFQRAEGRQRQSESFGGSNQTGCSGSRYFASDNLPFTNKLKSWVTLNSQPRKPVSLYSLSFPSPQTKLFSFLTMYCSPLIPHPFMYQSPNRRLCQLLVLLDQIYQVPNNDGALRESNLPCVL